MVSRRKFPCDLRVRLHTHAWGRSTLHWAESGMTEVYRLAIDDDGLYYDFNVDTGKMYIEETHCAHCGNICIRKLTELYAQFSIVSYRTTLQREISI